ncbi:MAG: class I SAM-dependent methyltransferase [Saprospiraceae bacterium]
MKRTEEPYWLEEAYKNVITNLDIGLVSRNISYANQLPGILDKHFNNGGKYLDYGGGYGMFVRLMRDRGFDFYRSDKYCENLFAKYFDISDLEKGTKFQLITAFEVFEHLPNPIEEIEKMFELSASILFSTLVQPGTVIHSASDWWYFAPETGQHVSFYSIKSLKEISKKFNKNLFSDGSSLHLLTEKKFPERILKLSFFTKISRKLFSIRNSSLLQNDFEYIKKNTN